MVETSSRCFSIAFVTLAALASSLSSRASVAVASCFASATIFMIFASWREIRAMNSVRVSRSSKPSALSTTPTRSGSPAL